MDMVSKCTKFDEDTPSRSEVKFSERRREWKLRNGFFPSFGRCRWIAETSGAAPCGLWYESWLACWSMVARVLVSLLIGVPVGRSSGLRLGGKCSISPSSLTTQRVPKEFAESWRKAVSYRTSTTPSALRPHQQNTLQRSTSTSGKSGVLNALYTSGVNGSVEKSWSWETEVKVTSGRQTCTFVRRGADHWNDRIRRKKNALCLFVAAALVPRQGRSTACPDAM